MRKVFSTIAAIMVAGSAYAEDVTSPNIFTGGVEVKLTEDKTTDKITSTTTLDLGLGADTGFAFGNIALQSIDGTSVGVDEWNMGTVVGSAIASIGDQGDIWIEAEGEHTMANPTMNESIQVHVDNVSVAMEFGDFKNDVSDIEAVAGKVSLGDEGLATELAFDYDLDAEAYTVGARVDMENVGGVVTYSETAEKFAFEFDTSMNGLTAYINGDEDELARNVGAGYEWDVNGLVIEPKANYDLDAEELTPSVTASFSF